MGEDYRTGSLGHLYQWVHPRVVGQDRDPQLDALHPSVQTALQLGPGPTHTETPTGEERREAELAARELEERYAREALDTFARAEGQFDLIFSDVILPDGNGLEVVLQLLKRNPALRVLFASGYTDERSKSAIIRDHHFVFLQKPYTIADLLRNIRQVLDDKKMG